MLNAAATRTGAAASPLKPPLAATATLREELTFAMIDHHHADAVDELDVEATGAGSGLIDIGY